jgi:hypothetical protein
VPGRPGEPGVSGPPGEPGSPGVVGVDFKVHAPGRGAAAAKPRHWLKPHQVPKTSAPLPPKKIHSSRPPPQEIVEEDTCSPKPADEYARHVKEAAAEITKAYPDWARSTGGALEPWGQSGEWTHYRGPPYVKKLTLWKGAGVDQVKEGTLWRRVLGLNTAAGRKCDLRSCDHAMTGNSYLSSFDGLIVFSLARSTLSSPLL